MSERNASDELRIRLRIVGGDVIVEGALPGHLEKCNSKIQELRLTNTEGNATYIRLEMKGQGMYYLAQVNIARMLAPLDDPIMADFVARLDEVNALADRSPGFIWRLQTAEGNATSVRVYEDELILLNMSVWTSLHTYSDFVYSSESLHRDVMKQRRRWFQRFDGPYMTLWWIPQGHLPTPEEAKERLEYLRFHDETAYAFSLKKSFPAPDASSKPLVELPEECLA